MGTSIENSTLYTFLFADDQVMVAGDEQNSNYMVRKLKEEYEKWDREMSFIKTERQTIGAPGYYLILEPEVIRSCECFKYLGLGQVAKRIS